VGAQLASVPDFNAGDEHNVHAAEALTRIQTRPPKTLSTTSASIPITIIGIQPKTPDLVAILQGRESGNATGLGCKLFKTQWTRLRARSLRHFIKTDVKLIRGFVAKV
jgi:hypothetical protein